MNKKAEQVMFKTNIWNVQGDALTLQAGNTCYYSDTVFSFPSIKPKA